MVRSEESARAGRERGDLSFALSFGSIPLPLKEAADGSTQQGFDKDEDECEQRIAAQRLINFDGK